MKIKKLLIPAGLILILTLLILGYFSPVNSKNITEISADNIDELTKIPFNIREFDLGRNRFDDNFYVRTNLKLFEDYSRYPVNPWMDRDEYLNEYSIANSDLTGLTKMEGQNNYSFCQSLRSEEIYLRIDGFYVKEKDKYPLRVELRPYIGYVWYQTFYPKEHAKYGMQFYQDRYYGEYFNKYMSETLKSFRQIGYIERKTNLKNGVDMLINNSIDSDKYYVIKYFDLGLVFEVYSKRRIFIPIMENLF